MKLNVATLLKVPGMVANEHIVKELDSFEFNGRAIDFGSPAEIDVAISYDGDCFTVTGAFKRSIVSRCSRCDVSFIEPLEFSFNEKYIRFVADEDDGLDAYEYNGDVLDLSQMINDNILLNLPISSVCSDKCLGRCPQCGQNLNTLQCTCAPISEVHGEDDLNNPFAGLMELFKDDKEV